jgi:hypothetical protein
MIAPLLDALRASWAPPRRLRSRRATDHPRRCPRCDGPLWTREPHPTDTLVWRYCGGCNHQEGERP